MRTDPALPRSRFRPTGRLAATVAASFALVALHAAPAMAQAKAGTTPSPNGACADGSTPRPGAEPCPPAADGQGEAGGEGDAVYLPDLLIDLFPFTPGAPAAPPETADGGQGGGSGGSQNAGLGGAGSGTPAPFAGLPPVAAPQAIAGEFVPDEVLVTVDGDAGTVGAIAADFGLEIRSQRTSALLGATIVRFGIPDGRAVATVLAQLETDGRTRRRAPNHVYTLQQAAGIANYAFERIALDPRFADGAGVAVAVIDTALQPDHPALADAIAESRDFMPGVAVADRNHATSVAGLIAGAGPFRGLAPGARIFHARAFEGGRSTMDIIIEAVDWAAEQDVRIVNMSFVGPKNEMLELACQAARARDMVLVAAAGNNGPGAPWGYPAAYDGVIAVTATDANDRLMPQANRGAYVFVAAPGVDMVAPVDGGTDLVTGTSFAAAIVSGAIANLVNVKPGVSAEWIEANLAATAGDLGKAGRDNEFGYGLIDYRGLAEAR